MYLSAFAGKTTLQVRSLKSEMANLLDTIVHHGGPYMVGFVAAVQTCVLKLEKEDAADVQSAMELKELASKVLDLVRNTNA